MKKDKPRRRCPLSVSICVHLWFTFRPLWVERGVMNASALNTARPNRKSQIPASPVSRYNRYGRHQFAVTLLDCLPDIRK
jgi:hypothetical protein